MSFFVSIEHRVPLSRIDSHLAGLQQDLAASPSAHPGRLHTRVFQSLSDPGHLISVGEWVGAADFRRFLDHPMAQEHIVLAEPPPTISTLARLRVFTHPARRPAVVACGLVTASPGTETELERFLITKTRIGLAPLDGLVSTELFRVEDGSHRFLQVHVWETFDDLDRFRSRHGQAILADLGALGATLERFVGAVAAEYLRPSANLSDILPPYSPR